MGPRGWPPTWPPRWSTPTNPVESRREEVPWELWWTQQEGVWWPMALSTTVWREREGAGEQPEGEQCEGGAAQVWQPGGRRVWEGMHSGRQRCHDLHECSKSGGERTCEEDCEEHREEHCKEYCGNGIRGEEGGDPRRY